MNFKNFFSKSFISLVLIIILFCSLCITPAVGANGYPKITIGKTVKGNLQDFWGGVTYEFNLFKDSNIKITYSSTVNTEVSLRDSKLNEIYGAEELKSIDKTFYLKKGRYTFGIYNCTYEKGTYSLSINNSVKYAESISFKTKAKALKVGSSFRISVIQSPKDAVLSSLKWSSSNIKIATVNQNGIVTAKALGKCSITAKLSNGSKAVCNITVNEKNLKISKGSKKTLPKINTATVKWKSENKSVARVTNNKVKGVSIGSTKLYATVGGIRYIVNVTVSK